MFIFMATCINDIETGCSEIYAKNKMNIIHLKRMEFSKIKDILKSNCREIINPIANI